VPAGSTLKALWMASFPPADWEHTNPSPSATGSCPGLARRSRDDRGLEANEKEAPASRGRMTEAYGIGSP
jgi:hypothetical protein